MTSPIDEMRPLFDWTSVRWNKCLKLYELAKETTGPIVELGAYTGNGTIALGLGSRDGHNVPVFGVDQWQRFSGLYKQQFYPEDYDKFKENVEAVGLNGIITPFRGDLNDVALVWNHGQIHLLVWDVSLPRLYDDWRVWHSLVVPGGLFVGKDTTVWDFGWQAVVDEAIGMGWNPVLSEMDACLWGVRRPL